jgi:hypothetical protein
MGVTNGAGLSLRWLRDTFAAGTPVLRRTHRRGRKDPAGSDGMLWAPYLFGERTPHLDPNARAALTGITASHTRAHFVRAVMEGVAFSLRDTLSLFAELKIPVAQHPPRRRRSARPALAADSGRCLRPARRTPRRRGGRRLRRSSAGRRRHRRMARRRDRLRRHRPRRRNHPAPPRRRHGRRLHRFRQVYPALKRSGGPIMSKEIGVPPSSATAWAAASFTPRSSARSPACASPPSCSAKATRPAKAYPGVKIVPLAR